MAVENDTLPEGFVVDELPEGFALDSQQAQQPQQPPTQISNTPQKQDLLPALLAIGAVGGTQIAANAVQSYVEKRAGDIAIKQKAIGALDGIQQQLGIQNLPGISPEQQREILPGKIQEIAKVKAGEYKLNINQTKLRFDNAIKYSKAAIDDFDNKIVSGKVSELSTKLEEYYPTFLKSASKGYEAGMNAIDGYFEAKGTTFNGLEFQNQVIDKALAECSEKGLSEAEVANIIKLKTQMIPPTNAMGEVGNEIPMKFSTMKGAVSGINKADPMSRATAIFNKNYVNYVDAIAPPEIKGMTEVLNRNYKQFAEARFQYSKIMSKAGEFNKSAANNYILDYLKSNVDNGVDALGKIISKGNDIMTGSEEIGNKFNEIQALKPQRAALVGELPQLTQLKKEALYNLEQEAGQVAIKMVKAQGQVNDLNYIIAKQTEKELGTKLMQIPKGIAGLAKLGRIVGKAGGMMSMTMMLKDAISFAQDPMAYVASQETAGTESPEEMRGARNRYQNKTMSKEEMINRGLIL